MVGSIRPTGVSSISAIGRGSAKGGSRAGGAMRRLAGNIGDRVAREFNLLDDERDQSGGDEPLREGEDIYEVRQVARELAADLQARPSEEGNLARSLDAFAQESVSLMAARPEAASLDTIARVIASHEKQDRPETFDNAMVQIDQTTRDIAESRPG